MVVMYDENGKEVVDNRHTVDIKSSYSFAVAIQVNNDGTFENVTYMDDDRRSWNNNAVVDATDDEIELYRKYCKHFCKGDKIIITKGRKMKGEIKEVKSQFVYRPYGTFGHNDIDYLVFTDGTKVNKLYCDFI